MGTKKRELRPKQTVAAATADVPVGMVVEHWSIDRLKPYARNPRKITKKAIDIVANSLKAFGFRQPIVVDSKGVIIAGHTRHLASKQLGLRTVPVHVASDMDATRIKAYRLADNKSGEKVAWLEDLLQEELEALDTDGVDMQHFGFKEESAEEILADKEEADKALDESVAGGGTGKSHTCPSCGFAWDPKEGKG